MGADIHCFIEYAANTDSDPIYWRPFGGHINPGRNYELFGRIGGVRGSDTPLIPLRGMPGDMGYEANADLHLYLTDSDRGEGSTTRAIAEKWVASGRSEYRFRGYAKQPRTTDEQPVFVTHPDRHSHTWLTPDEWENAISNERDRATAEANAPAYHAMLAAMRSLEHSGCTVRVIVSFDN